MHLLPDAAEDAETLGIENYPTAYMFCAVGFFLVFFVQKVLSPMLSPPEVEEAQPAIGGGTCCSAGAGALIGKVGGSPLKSTYIPTHNR